MFKNIIDLLMILVIILFSFSVLRHYSSINNINDISFKRDNIENTLRNKIENSFLINEEIMNKRVEELSFEELLKIYNFF